RSPGPMGRYPVHVGGLRSPFCISEENFHWLESISAARPSSQVPWAGPQVSWAGPQVSWADPQVPWADPQVPRVNHLQNLRYFDRVFFICTNFGMERRNLSKFLLYMQ